MMRTAIRENAFVILVLFLGFGAACSLTGCAQSMGETAAYEALDQGWQRIRPLADAGLDARDDLTIVEKDFIRGTFERHGQLITELKSGGGR
jgi:hypothetical protein